MELNALFVSIVDGKINIRDLKKYRKNIEENEKVISVMVTNVTHTANIVVLIGRKTSRIKKVLYTTHSSVSHHNNIAIDILIQRSFTFHFMKLVGWLVTCLDDCLFYIDMITYLPFQLTRKSVWGGHASIEYIYFFLTFTL